MSETESKKKTGYTEEEQKIIMDIVSRAFAEAHKKVAQEIRSGYITPDMSREEILSLPLWENDSPLELLTTNNDDI